MMANQWQQIERLLDQVYHFNDKLRSSLTCADQTYEPNTSEYVITLEYKVTVPKRDSERVGSRLERSLSDIGLLQAILADVREIKAMQTGQWEDSSDAAQ